MCSRSSEASSSVTRWQAGAARPGTAAGGAPSGVCLVPAEKPRGREQGYTEKTAGDEIKAVGKITIGSSGAPGDH